MRGVSVGLVALLLLAPMCGSWGASDIGRLLDEVHIENIEKKLQRHDASALSIIPSVSGTAYSVFAKYNLHVNDNSAAGCYRTAIKPLKESGCIISIYVSRKRASGKYSELAGFHAVWIRGLTDQAFTPANEWAEHISNADSWLSFGGALDTQDRP
jgi:hypothetical protein